MKRCGTVGLIVIAALSLAIAGCLWAPDLDGIRKDIERQIPGASFEREIALSLGPVSLAAVRFALSFTPDTREVGGYVAEIRSVGVAVYSARNLPADFDLELPAALETLAAREGWEIVIKASERKQAVWVLCKEDKGSIGGVYVVALDETELVLVRAQGELEEVLKRALHENSEPGKIARGLCAGLGGA